MRREVIVVPRIQVRVMYGAAVIGIAEEVASGNLRKTARVNRTTSVDRLFCEDRPVV